MQCQKVNMDNYRCYLTARVRIFKSPDRTFSLVLLFLGCICRSQRWRPRWFTSCDGGSDDDVTFSFHTCMVCGLDIDGVGSSFMVLSGS
jgi:hypothetical protein